MFSRLSPHAPSPSLVAFVHFVEREWEVGGMGRGRGRGGEGGGVAHSFTPKKRGAPPSNSAPDLTAEVEILNE